MAAVTPKIPPELAGVMKDLAKLILRDSPSNVYEYAAEYFENRIRARDGHLNKNYERFSGGRVKVVRQQSAPEVLEAKPKTPKSGKRGRSGKRKETKIKEGTIDRGKPLADKYNEARPPSKTLYSRVTEKSLVANSNIGGVEEEEAGENGRWLLGRAAVRIQQAYRRYRVRKIQTLETTKLKQSVQNGLSSSHNEDNSVSKTSTNDSMALIRSTVLIQKLIRGYIARKRYQDLKLQLAQVQKIQDVEFEEVLDLPDEPEKPTILVQNEQRQKVTTSPTKALEKSELDAVSIQSMQSLADAALKIQKIYRGYKTRRMLKDLEIANELIEIKQKSLEKSLHLQDVASPKNMHQTQQETNVSDSIKNQDDELQDFSKMATTELSEFEKAASTIQNVYKSFKGKNDQSNVPETKENEAEDLPDFSKMTTTELSEFEKAASTIQNVYKGFKGKKDQSDVPETQENEAEDLPDFSKMTTTELSEFEKAASTIQNVYKGFKGKKDQSDVPETKENEAEDLPDFSKMTTTELSEFEKAASTIQNVYKGFKGKKDQSDVPETQENEAEDLPDFSKMTTTELSEFEKAASTIQNVYKGFKGKKDQSDVPETQENEAEDLPDFSKMTTTELSEFEKAASTIQNVYKGFKGKKDQSDVPETQENEAEDLPDFSKMTTTELSEFEKAASTIQNVYKGFKGKKDQSDIAETKENEAEDLPDFSKMTTTELSEFEKAASTIQNVYKGFKGKKDQSDIAETKENEAEDLPDFSKMTTTELSEFEKAASTIQNVYKGFKGKKDQSDVPETKENEAEDLPDFSKMTTTELSEFEKAASTIQNVYKGFKGKKDQSDIAETKENEAEDLPDFSKMTTTELSEFEKAASTIQNVYKGFKGKKDQSDVPETQENEAEDLPDFSKMTTTELSEFEKAASTIQNVYKGFKGKKDQSDIAETKENEAEDLPDFSKMTTTELSEFEKAASTIQNVYKGFKGKKDQSDIAETQENEAEDLPDFSKMTTTELSEFEKAASTIQNVYKGFKGKKDQSDIAETKENEAEDLPDFSKMTTTELSEFEKAASTIQNVYKGFKGKKNQSDDPETKEVNDEDLSDFSKIMTTELSEFEKAASTIQTLNKGFKVNKTNGKPKEQEISDESREEKAALQIQKVYRGYKTRCDLGLIKRNSVQHQLDENKISCNSAIPKKGIAVQRSGSESNFRSSLEKIEEESEVVKTIEGTHKESYEATSSDNEVSETLLAAIFGGSLNEEEIKEQTISGRVTEEADNVVQDGGVDISDSNLVDDEQRRRELASEASVTKEESIDSGMNDDSESKDRSARSTPVDKTEIEVSSLSLKATSLDLESKASDSFDVEAKFQPSTSEAPEASQQVSRPQDSLIQCEKDIETGECVLPKSTSSHSSQKLGFEKLAIDDLLTSSDVSDNESPTKLEVFEEINDNLETIMALEMKNEVKHFLAVPETSLEEFCVPTQKQSPENSISLESPAEATRDGDDIISIDSLIVENALLSESDLNDSLEAIPKDSDIKTPLLMEPEAKLEVESVKTSSVPSSKPEEDKQDELSVAEIIQQSSGVKNPNTSSVDRNKFKREAFSVDRQVFGSLRQKETETKQKKGGQHSFDDSKKSVKSATYLKEQKSNQSPGSKIQKGPIKQNKNKPTSSEDPVKSSKAQYVQQVTKEKASETKNVPKTNVKYDAKKTDSETIDPSNQVSLEAPQEVVEISPTENETPSIEKESLESADTPPQTALRIEIPYKRLETEDDKEDILEPQTVHKTQSLTRQTTVEEPPFVQKSISKTYPEIVDEVSEIVSFDTSTHDKSVVEEEYYKLKKKEIEGIDPEIIPAMKRHQSLEEPTEPTSTDPASRPVTSESSDVVFGRVESVNLDTTVVLRDTRTMNRTLSTADEDVVIGNYGEAKALNETYVVEHRKPETLNETYVIAPQKLVQPEDSNGAEEAQTVPAESETQKTTTSLNATSSLNKTFVVEKPTPEPPIVTSTTLQTEGTSLDNESLEELKNLSSVPNRRRLISSLTVAQPSIDDSNPMYHVSIYTKQYMDRLHGSIDEAVYGSDREVEVEDEDRFDDFYPGNIQHKIMASSFSVADSDYFDPHKPVENSDDSKIVTALEAITSTESDTTTSSVDTKVPQSRREKILSFGDTAITPSLEDFAMQTELPSIPDLEGSTERTPLDNQWSSGSPRSRDSTDTLPHTGNIIQIKLDHKPSSESTSVGRRSSDSSASEDTRGAAFKEKKMSYYSLNVEKYDTAARRLLLQRENAVQGNSTPEDDLSAKSSGSMEVETKLEGKKPSIAEEEEAVVFEEVLQAASAPEQEAHNEEKQDVQEAQSVEKSSSRRSNSILRQRTLPVQIDTSIMRILPRHIVKRIKSAESNQNRKLFSKPANKPGGTGGSK